MLEHVQEHYARLTITHAPYQPNYPAPYWLLRAVENKNAKKPVVTSVLSAGLMRAILEGARYPEALFQNALLRIRATHEVTYERAAIIKAYLLRNQGFSEREATVTVNEERNETAYALGRAFAVLEQIQERANGSSNIASRYVDSASSTPAVVFPTLLRLAQAHLTKIERDAPGLARYFSQQLSDMLSKERVYVFPRRLTLIEQGDFFLGYYQQAKKRYEKKTSDSAEDPIEAAENQEV